MKGDLEPTELPLIKHWPNKRLLTRINAEGGNFCRGLQLKNVYPISTYESGFPAPTSAVKLEKKVETHVDMLLNAAAAISPRGQPSTVHVQSVSGDFQSGNVQASTKVDDDENFVTLRLPIPAGLPKDSEIRKLGYSVSTFYCFKSFYSMFKWSYYTFKC